MHSLKLLAAHCIVSSKLNDSLNEDDLHVEDPNRIAATSGFREMAYNQVPSFQVLFLNKVYFSSYREGTANYLVVMVCWSELIASL